MHTATRILDHHVAIAIHGFNCADRANQSCSTRCRHISVIGRAAHFAQNDPRVGFFFSGGRTHLSFDRGHVIRNDGIAGHDLREVHAIFAGRQRDEITGRASDNDFPGFHVYRDDLALYLGDNRSRARGPDDVIAHLLSCHSVVATLVMTRQRHYGHQCQSGDNGENRFNQHLHFQVSFST